VIGSGSVRAKTICEVALEAQRGRSPTWEAWLRTAMTAILARRAIALTVALGIVAEWTLFAGPGLLVTERSNT